MFKGINLFEKSSFTTTALVLAFLLILFLPYMGLTFYKAWSSMKSWSIKYLWLILALVYFCLYLLVFPGFISYDDLSSAAIIRGGIPNGWQSLTYSLFLAVGEIIFNGFGFTTAVCIVLFLYISLKIFVRISESGLNSNKKSVLAWIIFLTALHPINQSILLFHCRDTLFSLLLFYLGFQLFEKYKWTVSKIIGFSVLIILLGDLRQEAKIYLIIFPMIFYLLKKWDSQLMKTYLLSITALGFIYYGLIASYFNFESYSHAYQVTAYVLPLSQIFHDKPSDQISDEHKKNINAVLDIKKLKDYFNPVDIDPFHQGGFNKNATEDEWQKFKKSALLLIVDNLDIFIKNRIFLFKTMLNINNPIGISGDELRRGNGVDTIKLKTKLRISNYDYPLSSLGEFYREGLYNVNSNGSLFQSVFFSLIFPLLFLLFCLFSIRRLPLIGSLALLIAIRLPIFFLLAPAGYVKYIYSVFLFFTFIPVLVLISFFSKKNANSA